MTKRIARSPLAAPTGMPLWAALPLAAASGPVLDAGFPDKNVWPLAFVGAGIVLACLIGRRAGAALLVGFVSGLSFYLVHVEWTSLYLGPIPWAALSILESLFFAVGSLAIALAYRWIPRVWSGRGSRLVLVPLGVAALWTAREWAAGSWPYGGFAWGRLAQSQSESPFAPLVSWVGTSGLSFLMVFLVAVTIQVAREPGPLVLSRFVLPTALAAMLIVVPQFPTTVIGSRSIAAVQGNGKAGYFDERSYGDLLAAQLSASAEVIGQDVDIMVWPEGGSDIDPETDALAAAALTSLSEALGDVPILLGTIAERNGAYYNTSLLWTDGSVADYYDKVRPVPFGEYVPDRDFWEPFAPDLIGLIGRDYTPGTRDAVMDADGAILGVSICFDVVDDELFRDTIDRGAQVLIAQTNNADFGTTDENQQQLAMARLRAIETGRALVNVSTVGRSQIIGADGTTIAEIAAYEPGAIVEDVPLMTGTTPAVALGDQIEKLIVFSGLGLLLAAGWSARRPRSRRRA